VAELAGLNTTTTVLSLTAFLLLFFVRGVATLVARGVATLVAWGDWSPLALLGLSGGQGAAKTVKELVITTAKRMSRQARFSAIDPLSL
jgi:hypothetical protein